jgi:hypothetical protein
LCDWKGLTANPNTTLEIMKEYNTKPWKREYLHKNPNITEEYVEELLNYPWFVGKFNWGKFSKHPNLSTNFIEKHMNTQGVNWNWGLMSSNPNVTLEFVTKHLHRGWSFIRLSMNGGISIKDLEKYQHLNIRASCSHPHMNIDTINNYINRGMSLDWKTLSSHPNITMEIIEKTRGCNGYYWDMFWVFRNPNMSMDFIKEYDWKNRFQNFTYPYRVLPECGWCAKSTSHNPNLTCDFVEEHIEKDWHWKVISANKFQIIQKNDIVI